MGLFNETQVRIASSLIRSPKTITELRQEVGIPLSQLEDELAHMIKLKVIDKSGYPTKYSVVSAVIAGVKETEAKQLDESKYLFKAHIIVEGQSKEEASLRTAQTQLLDKLRSDPLVRATNIKEEPVKNNGVVHASLFEADISAKAFEDLLYVVLNYGPSSIEMTAPNKFELSTRDGMNLLMDVANTLHAYVGLIIQVKMAADEEKAKNSKELTIV